MKVVLLDVNVLIALLWPSHEHHGVAHHWFQARGRTGWATCPLTELGFVRIVSNPSFSTDALSPRDALALLGRNLAHPGHKFWADDLAVSEAFSEHDDHIQGHRQFTDVYLVALARSHHGTLASFDGGLRQLAPGDRASALEVVPTA